MKCPSAISLVFLLRLCIQSVSSQSTPTKGLQNAIFPPRGWNSYDSYSWIVTEDEYLQNAYNLSQRLLVHGYEYAVVDFLWYRSLKGDVDSLGFDAIDEWGRMRPNPERWPSSRGGKGFSEVAGKVHGMGLKFGIHVMAGISTQAFNKNTPILDTTKGCAYEEAGRVWRAKDIGLPSKACTWMPHGFMAVNATSGAGKAFLRSLYVLYASWGVDFVKLDCVFGSNFDLDEITTVSEVLKGLDQPIVFSVSPGVGATPDMAKKAKGLVNMYRITTDDWDNWSDVASHFNISRDFAAANLIGADGLMGKSWPDLDMLPLGWLTDPGVKEGPHRFTKLNKKEQKTQMTLWCMAKSPLMYGGDLRKVDKWTLDLITNPTLLEINAFSSYNMEFPYITWSKNTTNGGKDLAESIKDVNYRHGVRSWIATGRKGEVYIAFFNLNAEKTSISAGISDLATVLFGRRSLTSCKGKEVWSGKVIATKGAISEEVLGHGCALFVLNCR